MWAQESGEDDNKANCMGHVSVRFIGRSTRAHHRHVSTDNPPWATDTLLVHELAKITLSL
jgi:hypothetical protein